jgi:hypothetical protein
MGLHMSARHQAPLEPCSECYAGEGWYLDPNTLLERSAWTC